MEHVESKIADLLEQSRNLSIRDKLNLLEALELGICTVDQLIDKVKTGVGEPCCVVRHAMNQ